MPIPVEIEVSADPELISRWSCRALAGRIYLNRGLAQRSFRSGPPIYRMAWWEGVGWSMLHEIDCAEGIWVSTFVRPHLRRRGRGTLLAKALMAGVPCAATYRCSSSADLFYARALGPSVVPVDL